MESESVGRVAAQLRSAAAEGPRAVGRVLADCYAEKISVSHEPPLSGDGSFDRETLAAHMEAEYAAIDRALPNMSYESVVEVDSSVISMTSTISGTTADGTSVMASTRTKYTVRDGEVVEIASEVDSETVATMLKLLTDAGFLPPGV